MFGSDIMMIVIKSAMTSPYDLEAGSQIALTMADPRYDSNMLILLKP